MLRIAFWLLIVILFMSFFGVSVQGLFENPTTQTNLDFVLGLIQGGLGSLWATAVGFVTGGWEQFRSFLPF